MQSNETAAETNGGCMILSRRELNRIVKKMNQEAKDRNLSRSEKRMMCTHLNLTIEDAGGRKQIYIEW
jgi:hypothetical protein